MERVREREHGGPAGRGARDLDGVLDRLGAGVEERGLDRSADRRPRRQPLGELDVRVVRDDREVGVQEAVDLRVHALGDRGVRVSDRQAADAACEVEEGVAVDVGEGRARGALDEDRDDERLGACHDGFLARDPVARDRAWDLSSDPDRMLHVRLLRARARPCAVRPSPGTARTLSLAPYHPIWCSRR